jgi:colanic acid biosynthesis glycosyl transferase WcaI
MKILIYSANFAPEPTGIGKYSGEMAQWLARSGHDVRVIAAPPYYPNWKISEDFSWRPFRSERWHGIKIRRAPLWIPSNPGGLARIVHLLSFAVLSCPLMLAQIFWRPDIVMTVAPAFLCAPAGWLTARLCGAKAWLHLQDFEVDMAFQLGLLKSSRLRRMVLWLERRILRRFDSVSTISNRMVEHLLEKGVEPGKTKFFPNWVDTTRFTPFEADGSPRLHQQYRQRLGIPDDAIVVLFSGSLTRKQGLMILPQVARRLAYRSDIVFVICGDGAMKEELTKAAEGVANLRLMPLQPFEKLGELLCMADIHVLPQSPQAEDLVLPSKLSGMIASGRPIIATCRRGTELERVVSNGGLVVPPDDVAALTHAVLELADDPVLRLSLGHSGRSWAESHVEQTAILSDVFGLGPAASELSLDDEPAVRSAG